MEAFGMMGWIFGLVGLTLAASANHRVDKLEKRLKASGVLDHEFRSDK
jgi:hypothetical protein